MQQAFEAEKQGFAKEVQSDTQQAIVREIQEARRVMKELEGKLKGRQREMITKGKEVGELEVEKRGKERQLKNATASMNMGEAEAEKAERQC